MYSGTHSELHCLEGYLYLQPPKNVQQGLSCISNSKTTSSKVVSMLLNALQLCTLKHCAEVGKCDYFRVTERGEKRQVPPQLPAKPPSRQWAELGSPHPARGAWGCESQNRGTAPVGRDLKGFQPPAMGRGLEPGDL